MDEMEIGGEGSVYELGFLLQANIGDDKLPEAFGAIKDVLVGAGATPISEEFPKLMVLAYTVEKNIANKNERFNQAYFGWIKFELPASKIGDVDAMIKSRVEVIRYLLVKTVRENTIAAKRVMGVRRRIPAKTSSKEGVDEKEAVAAPEMTKEEIDREIEALVDDKAAA